MPYLGKGNVLIRSYLNGELTREKTVQRGISADAKGRYFVSYLGVSHGREVTKQPDGSFLWELHATTIPSRSFADIIANVHNSGKHK